MLTTAHKYDPASREDRTALAAQILDTLAAAGFTVRPNSPRGQEKQLARRVRDAAGAPTDLQIVVYTTIDGSQVRDVGEDAIRVALLYRTREIDERTEQRRVVGVGSTTRVHRVGEIVEIVKRIHGRIAEVEASVSRIDRCRQCGAPRVQNAKKTAYYCAEKCWVAAEAMKGQVR